MVLGYSINGYGIHVRGMLGSYLPASTTLMIMNRCTCGTPTDGPWVYVADPGL